MGRFLATGMIFVIFFGILFLGGIIGTIVMVAVRASGLSNRTGDGKRSFFDGGAFAYIGWTLLVALIDVFSLGFAYPWALCLFQRWEKKHTVINGRRLCFNGRGIEIFGWNILWNFLTLITFGIFAIWRLYYVNKWIVKHTVYEDGFGVSESRFTGGGGAWFVHMLFIYLMTVFSFGFATPWAIKTFIKWETANTEIGGSPLVFKGTGGQLFGRAMLWGVLNISTFGLFALFLPVFMKDWMTFNTDALYATDAIQGAAHSHETMAMRDFANIKIAATQSTFELEKSGITNETSDAEIAELASRGNAIAKYRLALIKKGGSESFEGEALDLLRSSSDAGYHIAMYEYSALAQTENEFLMLLDGSARRGNMQAVRKLRDFYTQRGYDTALANSERTKNLSLALYWFKISIELGDAESVNMQRQYNGMMETLSVLLCGEPGNRPSSKVSTATVVWTSILSVVVLLPMLIVIAYMIISGVIMSFESSGEENEYDEYAEVIFGDDDLRVETDDIHRQPSGDYNSYGASDNFEFSGTIDDYGAKIYGYLGDFARVDQDAGVTYIDFGISEDTRYLGGDCSFFLISEDLYYDKEDGAYEPLSGVVRPGESITKINKALPEGIYRISVMMYNGNAYKLQGTVAATPGGTHILFNGGDVNSDLWVAEIFTKTVKVISVGNDQQGSEESKEVEESVADTETLESAVIGEWETATRSDNYIISTVYVFNSDGTFSYSGCEYMHTSYAPELFAGMPEGWQTVPMGYAFTSGNYTVEGNRIVMTGKTIEAGEEWDFDQTLTVRDGDSEFLTVADESGKEQKYYKCVGDASIEDVCNALGISTAP